MATSASSSDAAPAVIAALKAIRTDDTAEARSALFETLEAAWDINAVLRLHQSPVLAIAFRKDESELLTWSTDNTLVHWDVAWRRSAKVLVFTSAGILSTSTVLMRFT